MISACGLNSMCVVRISPAVSAVSRALTFEAEYEAVTSQCGAGRQVRPTVAAGPTEAGSEIFVGPPLTASPGAVEVAVVKIGVIDAHADKGAHRRRLGKKLYSIKPVGANHLTVESTWPS
jgi:hypothetical protein